MSGYGAVNQAGALREAGTANSSRASQKTIQAKSKALNAPLFLENPDGTIAEAVPSHCEESKVSKPWRRPEGRSRGQGEGGEDSEDSIGGLSNLSENAAVSMYQEVEFLYSQHERVLLVLLFLHSILVILYNVVYVLRMRDGTSVQEFVTMYGLEGGGDLAAKFLWSIFAVQVVYNLTYYGIAMLAVWTRRPSHYRLLANCGIAGIIGLVLLAYVDKFNLVIFFLQLLAYIYARFLQGLTASLLLLPPAPAPMAATAP